MSRIPQPIKAKGSTKKRWQSSEDAGHRAVLSRVKARRGMCEAPRCDLPAAEDAHMFSRGRVAMSAPWCHSPHLRRGLCRGHHQGIDRNVLMELRDAMRWEALAWFCEAEGMSVALHITAGDVPCGLELARSPKDWPAGERWRFEDDPLDAAHHIDRLMHELWPNPVDWSISRLGVAEERTSHE